MKDKQGLNRWSLLEQAGTVLDERFHHDAIYSHLVETAAYGRQLEAEITRLRAEVERLRMTSDEQDDIEHAMGVLMGSSSARCRVAARSLMRLLGRHGVAGFDAVHDAAPAARASLPTADHAVCRGRESGCGTGNTTREPVAWGVLPGGDLPLWRCRSREQAEAVRAWLEQQRPGLEPKVVPLVDGRAAPTLTDAEREAIKSAMDIAEAVGRPELRGALRALLARHGGDA